MYVKRVITYPWYLSETLERKQKHKSVYVNRVTPLVPVSSVVKTRQIHEFGELGRIRTLIFSALK